MGELEVLFSVPDWVEAGVKSGDLRIFGGVVREASGPIAHHLVEAIRREPRRASGKVAIGVGIGVVVAAAAAGAYWVYGRVSRKKRALAALNPVDDTMAAYLAHARDRHLTIDDVEAFAAALSTCLDTWRKPEFREVQILVSDDVSEKLRDVLRCLCAFNQAAHEQVVALPEPPPSTLDGGSIVTLLDDLLEQVIYQESALEALRVA